MRVRLLCALGVLSVFAASATVAAAQTTADPFRDAGQGFPRITDLVRSAERYVHVATWAFDDEIRWSVNGQAPIRLRSRQNGTPLPGTSVENLRCNDGPLAQLPGAGPPGPADPASSITVLRCTAAAIALKAELRAGTPGCASTQRAEVMVLVWNNRLDKDYAPPDTNLDDLTYINVVRAQLVSWTPTQLHDAMRTRGSGESMAVLCRMQALYRSVSAKIVPMPTGIAAMVQQNRNGVFASHHQKLVVTDTGAYVGGLNFLKEYWDDTGHTPSDVRRMSSAAGGADTGPLHDTGAIFRGDATADVNQLFYDRWRSNITHWHGVDESYAGLFGTSQTPFFRLKEVVGSTLGYFAARPVRAYLGTVEAAVAAQPALGGSTPGASGLVAHAVLRVSRPKGSYFAASTPEEIRNEYTTTINGWMRNPASFAYFENQYVQDHDFAQTLFSACSPRIAWQTTWCRRDRFAYFVVPYAPRGLGGSNPVTRAVDRHVVATIVHDEMQTMKWLEIKTAATVYDRATGALLATLERPGPCTKCAPRNPVIRFADPKVENDPRKLELDSIVEYLGTEGHTPPKLCDPPPAAPRMMKCAIQPPQPRRVKVSEIITDSAVMAFSLVNSGRPTATSKSGASAGRYANYHAFLADPQRSIYIHSKHSEFFGKSGTVQRVTYVMGSANLNPRSLGFLPTSVTGAFDAEDSESAIFYTPADLSYWRELWTEHLGALGAGVIPIDAAETWAAQGWRNWNLISNGGAPPSAQRVVRLDVVERCIRLGGC